MTQWTEEKLRATDAMKLNKYKCPKCYYVNPVMGLINTINCLNCGTPNDIVENGYVIEMSEDE